MPFSKAIIPAFIWTIITFILLTMSVPDSASIPRIRIPHFDKVVHFGLFAILALSYSWGFKKQLKYATLIKFAFYFAASISIIIGIVTELLQAYLIDGRNGDIYDLLADTFGTFGGILFFIRIQKKYFTK